MTKYFFRECEFFFFPRCDTFTSNIFFLGFELNDKGVVDEQDEDESTSNNNLMSGQMGRPLVYRIWKYLKTTWTGVIARNGKI